MTTTTDVVVVGGGLAGLAAAAFLARAGLGVHLAERSATPGGRARTSSKDGFALNRGPHALYRAGEGLGVLRELDVAVPGRVVPAAGCALRNGKLHRLPVDSLSLLGTGLLGVPGKLAAASWLGRLPELPTDGLERMSAAEWLDGWSLPADARQLFEAYFRL